LKTARPQPSDWTSSGVLYLAGGVAGQLSGYAWQPHGAGNSVAICGLAGGLLIAALRYGAVMPRPAIVVALLWVAVLTGDALAHSAGAAVAGGLVAWPFLALTHRAGIHDGVYRVAALLGTALAVPLSVMSNLHGPAVLAGLAVGAILPLDDSQRLKISQPARAGRAGR
jgi:hypothetical protein